MSNASNNELAKKEMLQQKHYLLLKELQAMSKDLPPIYQQRLPNELLSSLASSLLDSTVFEIVNGLKDIQQMSEKNLFQQRLSVINAHKAEKAKMLKKHKELITSETHVKPHNVAVLKSSLDKEYQDLEKVHESQIVKTDTRIIMELDQTITDQQMTLERAGIPGFYVSNKPNEIQLQMYLLEFINTLGANAEINENIT